jgi:hypothetical protein
MPYKCFSPVLANWVAVMLSEQGISHLFNSSKPRQKPSRVKVEYMLNNYLLLCLKQAARL